MSQRPENEGAAPGRGEERRPAAAPGTGDAPQAPPQYGQYAASTPTEHGQYGATPTEHGQYGAPATSPVTTSAPGTEYGQYGVPASGGYYGPGFTQVPAAVQPGIIPLRPLTLGEIYDGAFRAIRSNPGVMFGLSALVVAVSTVIELAVVGAYLADLETFLLSGSTDLDGIIDIGTLSGMALATLATTFATVVLTGLLILSVSESVLGRTISIGALWQRARGQMWRLIGLTVLLGLAGSAIMVVAVIALVALVALLASVSADLALLGVFVGLVMFFAFTLVLAWFAVRTMLAPPAIMLERSRVLASVRRSWRLSKGSFWRLLGIMLLTFVLLAILQGILTVPFSIIGAILGGSGAPTWTFILGIVGQSLAAAVAIPFVAAVLALLYIDVRMRTEALDVELARAAQEG